MSATNTDNLKITGIDIKNFRSTRDLFLSPERLTVLVGRNDSGKSNVLRALNLFFNYEADPAEYLDFDIDYNVFNNPNRRAREIKIKLEIELPAAYKNTNGDYVVWKKHWRSTGKIVDKYTGYIRGRGKSKPKEIAIPGNSRLHTLLRNINFNYVPAIKDLEYFSQLQANIYSIIAEVANKKFRDSSQAFERSIANQVSALTTEIANSLGFHSRLALPKDLSHIFESLDFLSKENISLEARGDGIKARHIPLILKFIADKKNELHGTHTFIWGYEEPENSLEFTSCLQLTDQFGDFLDNGISQIFLTTHSPIFYNLSEDKDQRVICYHMFQDTKEGGTKQATDLGDLDERMGATALLAPMVGKVEDRIRRRLEANAEAKRLVQAKRRLIFVEGMSDKKIIDKAIRVFAPDLANKINVETMEYSAGINYVVDMLQSWRSRAKHHSELPRAAGLLDQDKEARKAAEKWNRNHRNVKSAKCFMLPKPPHIQPLLQKKFNIPVVLEILYGKKTWEWADGRGYLMDRDTPSVIPPKILTQIINGKTKLSEHLCDDWAIFVMKEFRPDRKVNIARYFAKQSNANFKRNFPFLEDLIKDIVEYLFPENSVRKNRKNKNIK